jgi:predicted Zn-dependent peptidase
MIKTYTFPNGFRLVYEKPPANFKNSAIQVFCKLGSIYEHDGIRGASHFIEHMCFKGTRKIPEAKTISENYDKIGAYFNASTYKQYTVYIVKCNNNYVENSIAILSDMMMNSTFKQSEFTKEKKVVEEESMRLENDHFSLITDAMEKQLYEGSSFENSIDELSYHTKNTLQYNDVVELYKTFYRPNNMVISIVSTIPFSHIVRFLETTYFMKKPATKCPPDHAWKYQAYYNIREQSAPKYSVIKRPGAKTTHVMIGFKTCDQFSNDKYILNVLNNIIGGYMSSRMFSTLREKNGLTYRSGSQTTYYDSAGQIIFFAETDPNKLLQNGEHAGVLPLIIAIISDLCKHGVTQREVANAKMNLEGSMMISMENSNASCEYNGVKMLLYCNDEKSIVPSADVYKTYYKSITRSQLNEVIKKYFKMSQMSVCILGEDVPPVRQIKKVCEVF